MLCLVGRLVTCVLHQHIGEGVSEIILNRFLGRSLSCLLCTSALRWLALRSQDLNNLYGGVFVCSFVCSYCCFCSTVYISCNDYPPPLSDHLHIFSRVLKIFGILMKLFFCPCCSWGILFLYFAHWSTYVHGPRFNHSVPSWALENCPSASIWHSPCI